MSRSGAPCQPILVEVVKGRLFTLEAIIRCYLVHHLLVRSILQAVRTTRMKEVMRNAVTSICVRSYCDQLTGDLHSMARCNEPIYY